MSVPGTGGFECLAGPATMSGRPQHTTQVHPSERRQPYVAGGLGLVDRELQGGRAGVVVPGLALGPTQARDLVCLGLLEPEMSRPVSGAADVVDRVVEAMLEPGQLAEHRLAADVEPRVLDRPEPALHPVHGVDAADLVSRSCRRPGGEQAVRDLVPRPLHGVVDGPAAISQLQRGTELSVVGDDVGEVIAAAGLQIGVVGRVGQFGRCGDVVAGEVEVAGRGFDPRREQESVGSVPGRASIAGRLQGGQDPLRAPAVAEDDPGPAEPVREAQRQLRVVCGAPGQCGVDVGALGPGEGEVLGLAGASHTLRGRASGLGEPGGVRRSGALGEPGRGHGIERESLDAVQQPVSERWAADRIRWGGRRCRPWVVDRHQRPAREPADHVDRRGGGHVEGFEDELHRREGGPARECGQRPQASLVVRKQQVVAPCDGRPERPAAFRPAAGRISQHEEPVVESSGDLFDGQRLGSCCGELDRQRQTVQGPAQVAHRLVVWRHGVASALRRGTAHEQADTVGQRQGCELEDDLAVDVEWDLAGAQDPQSRGGIQEADRKGRGLVEHVFAVVEHHQRRGVLERLEQRRLSAGAVDRTDQHVDDLVCRAGALQPGQPDAIGPQARRRGQPARDRQGHRRLPNTARPDDFHQPFPSQQVGHGGNLVLAAHQLHRHRRKVPDPPYAAGPRRRANGDFERGVLDQDPALELLQLWSGVQTQLGRQLPPDLLVRRQGVHLTSGPILRGDQQFPQALLERVRCDRCLEVTDHVADLTEPQPRPEGDLEERRPGLFKACPVRGDPSAITGGLEHIAAVQPQRRSTQVSGTEVVSGLEQSRRGGRCAQRGERVDVGRCDRERVAAIATADHGRVAERPAQHRDLRLQRVASRAEAVRRPQVRNEPIHPDQLPVLEGETHHQLRRLAAGDLYAPAVAGDLEDTQHRDGNHRPSLSPPGRDWCQVAVSGSSAHASTVSPCPPTSRSCSAD